MKKITFIHLFFITCFQVFAQVGPPKKINYQAVARDVLGKPFSNKILKVEFSIYNNSAGVGTPLFLETHTSVPTNKYGLFTIEIGSITPLTISWSGDRYLKIGIDTVGGAGLIYMPVNQMLSVPYALYADSAKYIASGANLAGWKLSGNNALTSDYIGTNNSQNFVIKANSSEQIRIDGTNGVVLIPNKLRVGGVSTSAPFYSGLEQITGTKDYGYIQNDGNVTLGTYIGDGIPSITTNLGGGIGTLSGPGHDFSIFTHSIQRITIKDATSNVGIGTNAPNASSVLDVFSDPSSPKGLLIPRMPLAQMNSIASPAKGLLVFETSSNQFYYYNGINWVSILGSTSSPWSRDAISDPKTFLTNISDKVGIGTSTPKNTLTVKGSVAVNLKSIVSNAYIMTNNDCIIEVTYPTLSTVTLPSTLDVDDGTFVIVRSRKSAIEVVVDNSVETIVLKVSPSGSSSTTVPSNYSLQLYKSGNSWIEY